MSIEKFDNRKGNDRRRDQEIYRYLFRMACVFHKPGEPDGRDYSDPKKINFSQTAKNFDEKADYAKRIYHFIKGNSESYNEPARLTTSELAYRIATLRKNLSGKATRQSEIINLFNCLISLTSEEQEDLGLDSEHYSRFLQQAFLNFQVQFDQHYKNNLVATYHKTLSSIDDEILLKGRALSGAENSELQ